MSKEKYIVDFTNVKYYLEMHEVIKKSLDFPDYYYLVTFKTIFIKKFVV